MLKDEIAAAAQAALRARDGAASAALRLALAAVRDLETDARAADRQARPDEVLGILRRMVRQRREAAELHRRGGRPELAEREEEEIEALSRFLPRELDDAGLEKVLDELIRETRAEGMRDVGRVMAGLKDQYEGRVDMRRASAALRRRLGGGGGEGAP